MPGQNQLSTVPFQGTAYDRSLALSGADEQVLPANPNRLFLLIFNPNAAAVNVNITGGVAGTGLDGNVALQQNGSLSFDGWIPTNAIRAQGTGGNVLVIIEG